MSDLLKKVTAHIRHLEGAREREENLHATQSSQSDLTLQVGSSLCSVGTGRQSVICDATNNNAFLESEYLSTTCRTWGRLCWYDHPHHLTGHMGQQCGAVSQ